MYVRAGLSLEPLLHGAGHEHGRRAGTENVMYAVGLGAACAEALRAVEPEQQQAVRRLRDRLWVRCVNNDGGSVAGVAEGRETCL